MFSVLEDLKENINLLRRNRKDVKKRTKYLKSIFHQVKLRQTTEKQISEFKVKIIETKNITRNKDEHFIMIVCQFIKKTKQS